MELGIVPEAVKGQTGPRVVFDHRKIEEAVLNRGFQGVQSLAAEPQQ